MKLGELLKKYGICGDYRIDRDLEFEALGLIEASLDNNFCAFIDDESYIERIPDNVTMILTSKDLADEFSGDNHGICIVEDPRNTFFKLHNCLAEDDFYRRKPYETKIGRDCVIHPSASISDISVTIGERCIIEENVVIRENAVIGDDCILRAGAVIGGEDFEFKRCGGKVFGVKHIGGVVLGNEVEVQYNSGINKALYPWDDTVIGDCSKIDMLVHIAHGVKIGKNVMVVANSGIGGRTVIGDDCWIGFASTLRNGITIGDRARVNMGSVVTKSVASGGSVTGNFAINHEDFIGNLKAIKNKKVK